MMCMLPSWCHYKSTIECQGQEFKPTCVQGNKTRTSCVIFVDQFSGLHYIHILTNIFSNETNKTKLAFDQFSTRHFVKIEHYHADHVCFVDNDNNSSIVGLMHMSRIMWPKEPSTTSAKAEENNCYTSWLDDQRQWISHMVICIALCSTSLQHCVHFKKIVFHEGNYSPALK
ncbi:hypothetical protein ACHAW6_009861 [Cyclotella cf. meneghiniana]